MELLPIALEDIAPENLKILRSLKKHPAGQLADLSDMLATYGYIEPIVAIPGDYIIAGEGLLTAILQDKATAAAAGQTIYETIQIVRVDMPMEDALLYVIAEDATREDNRWDARKLKENVATLQAAGFNLKKAGLSTQDVNNIMLGTFVPPVTLAEPSKAEKFRCMNCTTKLKFTKNGQVIEVGAND